MKRLLPIFVLGLLSIMDLVAQEPGNDPVEYVFTDEIILPSTPVQNQSRTSTCWAFSALSFFESEMIRNNRPEMNFSEMFVVYHTYTQKAQKYVRMQGNTTFAPGGAFHDVCHVFRNYGLVPESVYKGLNYGEDFHSHGEMDKLLKEQVDVFVTNPNRKLSTVWREPVNATLEAYLGKVPEHFTYSGTTFTPQSFTREYTGLNMDDYLEITSFLHHPFYTTFILEVPDNWSWDPVYNVPLEELGEIIDNALRKGYTVAWASDTSDPGFQYRTRGIAFVPCEDTVKMTQQQKERWERLSRAEREAELYSARIPVAEAEITPEVRQVAFDNFGTTDDHGMHIIGTARDQSGNSWYKVKNSWGSQGRYNGYLYASKAYVNYKTTCIMVHKEAIPHGIRKKLGI